MAVCLRYADANHQLMCIYEATTGCVKELGLSFNKLRGQGYDGALMMSGKKSGVQKRIRDKQPKAVCWEFFQFGNFSTCASQERDT